MKINKITKIFLDSPKPYYDVINANPYNNFLVKCKDKYIISHNCFLDEISFIKNQEIDKQKKIAMDMMDTAIAGMKTRFINKGKNPTLLVLASSKRSEKWSPVPLKRWKHPGGYSLSKWSQKAPPLSVL